MTLPAITDVGSLATAIIDMLVSSITGLAQGIGNGISTAVKSLFFEEVTSGGTTTTTLSVAGVLVCIFGGIALAVGLTRLVTHWVMSLGGSRI